MNFCLYTSSVYLKSALICRNTLLKHSPNSHLYILCFDENTYNVCKDLPSTTAIFLKEIEEYYPTLLTIKNMRREKEYYATISPILPLYIFDTFEVETLYYTDADMAFYADPKNIEDTFGNYSLMVSDHGFEPPRSKVRFNVGILAYRNDEKCRKFLNWWRNKCIEWCYWITTPDGRCADQGWLNILHDEPECFPGWFSCPQPGINLGPWNAWRYEITAGSEDGQILLNKKFPLICYHFHEFKMLGNGKYYPTGWKLPENAIELIYEPYVELYKKEIKDLI